MMSAINEYKTMSYSVGSGHSSILTKKSEHRDGTTSHYFEGTVFTPNGIVYVFSCENWTSMNLVYKGRKHYRQWKSWFMPRTLSSLAKKFSKEICGAK